MIDASLAKTEALLAQLRVAVATATAENVAATCFALAAGALCVIVGRSPRIFQRLFNKGMVFNYEWARRRLPRTTRYSFDTYMKTMRWASLAFGGLLLSLGVLGLAKMF